MIHRTYFCPECDHRVEVELNADQWDAPPPECPNCVTMETKEGHGAPLHQEFKPPAIGGSKTGKAIDLALDIAEKDYGVADIQTYKDQGSVPKVRYKDQSATASSWGAQSGALAQAISLGRENRLRYGSGLEVLQTSLKNGSQPDIIEASKRRLLRG